MLIFLLLLLVPVLEIYVFVQVGGEIGAGTTVWLVLLTAIIGIYLVKRQGAALLVAMQQKTAENKLPSAELFEGVCLAGAGAFLITPGFVTDTVGFLLLWPAFRAFLRTTILDTIIGNFTYGFADSDTVRRGKEKFDAYQAEKPSKKTDKKQSTIIDAEFEMIDDNDKPVD